MANDLSLHVCSPASPEWISARVETLLSHYFQPTVSEEVELAAMGDWINALSGFSRDQIGAACDAHLRESKRRPTPAEIRSIIKAQRGRGQSRLANLTGEEADKVSTILSTARRHVETFPAGTALHNAGKATIAYWEAAE